MEKVLPESYRSDCRDGEDKLSVAKTCCQRRHLSGPSIRKRSGRVAGDMLSLEHWPCVESIFKGISWGAELKAFNYSE